MHISQLSNEKITTKPLATKKKKKGKITTKLTWVSNIYILSPRFSSFSVCLRYAGDPQSVSKQVAKTL